MKKNLTLLLYLAFTASLVGCGNAPDTAARNIPQTTSVTDVLNAGMAEADSTATAENTAAGNAENESNAADATIIPDTTEFSFSEDFASEDPITLDEEQMVHDPDPSVDLDLTALSSTMVYSEVYNIMMYPEDYIGKTIKMNGIFVYYLDELTGLDYYSCIIQDATACCAQGIEFELTDDYHYPEDYPEQGGDICVVGEFDTYYEDDFLYCTLRNAHIAE